MFLGCKMIRFVTKTEEATEELGKKIGQLVKAGTLILLRGDLGSGKTVLSRGIARGLGVEAAVTSPTFTLMHQYQGRLPLFHFDIYRITDPEEMFDLDYEEYFYGDGVTVVEWPERMEELLPDEYILIEIEKTDRPDERQITIALVGEKYKDLEGALNSI